MHTYKHTYTHAHRNDKEKSKETVNNMKKQMINMEKYHSNVEDFL